MKLKIGKPTLKWVTIEKGFVTFIYRNRAVALACAGDGEDVERVEVLVRRRVKARR